MLLANFNLHNVTCLRWVLTFALAVVVTWQQANYAKDAPKFDTGNSFFNLTSATATLTTDADSDWIGSPEAPFHQCAVISLQNVSVK